MIQGDVHVGQTVQVMYRSNPKYYQATGQVVGFDGYSGSLIQVVPEDPELADRVFEGQPVMAFKAEELALMNVVIQEEP